MSLIRPGKKRPKMGVRVATHIRCPAHLRWIKTRACIIEGKYSTAGSGYQKHECSVTMDPHHVHGGTDGGIGIKPSDCYTIPLCRTAHDDLHWQGEESFERRWKLGPLKAIADQAWAMSPAGKRWRMTHDQDGEGAGVQEPRR